MPGLTDTNPRIVYAAVYCVAELCTYLEVSAQFYPAFAIRGPIGLNSQPLSIMATAGCCASAIRRSCPSGFPEDPFSAVCASSPNCLHLRCPCKLYRRLGGSTGFPAHACAGSLSTTARSRQRPQQQAGCPSESDGSHVAIGLPLGPGSTLDTGRLRWRHDSLVAIPRRSSRQRAQSARSRLRFPDRCVQGKACGCRSPAEQASVLKSQMLFCSCIRRPRHGRRGHDSSADLIFAYSR